MIPNYSNWLAKRVWAVNQSHRPRPMAGSTEPSSDQSWLGGRSRTNRWEARRGSQEAREHAKWFGDRSADQKARDYQYLEDALSGALGKRLRGSYSKSGWERAFSQVTERLQDIGRKYGIDLEQYAQGHFPQHYHKDRGDAALRSGAYAEARSEYEEALRAGGEDEWVALVNLSSTYLMEDRLSECEDACRRALAINPRSAGAYFNLGQVAAARGNGPEAERYLARAMDLDDKIRRQVEQMGFDG